MFPKMRKAICGLCAVLVMAAASVTAFADYTYQLDGELCDEINSDYKDINGAEGTFETEFGDSTQEKYLSLRFKLFNEYLDADYWNNANVTVSVDVKLETQGSNVIGCMPGFNSKWGWINPSDYTPLKYGEWVTISEKGSHFYEKFSEAEPAYILLQVRTNWGAEAQGNVKISVRNFRITDGTGEAVVQPEDSSVTESDDQPASTADTVEDSDPAVTDNSDPAVTDNSDPAVSDNSDPEVTSENSGTENPEPEKTTAATSATTIRTAATVATSSAINYSELYAEPESPVMMIIIIIGVAVVIIVGAIIGYMIYRKKKYY